MMALQSSDSLKIREDPVRKKNGPLFSLKRKSSISNDHFSHK